MQAHDGTLGSTVLAEMGDKTIYEKRPRERLLSIERCKGLAILLVVFGHLVPFADANGHLTYQDIKFFVYQFHMPFFMLLSGFVFFHTGNQEKNGAAYGPYLLRRADRLLLPFLGFALVVILGKFAASHMLRVHDSVDNLSTGFIDTISNTKENPTLSIWYLLVLFLYCVITPPLFKLLRGRIELLLALALVMHFVSITELYYINRFFAYYFFFVLGGFASLHYARFLRITDRMLPMFAAIVLASFLVYRQFPYMLLFYGFFISVMLFALMHKPFLQNERFLVWVGGYSMAIYLLNTVAIGVFKAVIVRIWPSYDAFYIVYLMLVLVVGAGVPIVGRMVLDRISFLRPIARYFH